MAAILVFYVATALIIKNAFKMDDNWKEDKTHVWKHWATDVNYSLYFDLKLMNEEDYAYVNHNVGYLKPLHFIIRLNLKGLVKSFAK